ncbi:MAG: SAM hydrolase/SAM-dependent halogenase family protein, partial [Micromonosporaceae bacterium]
DRMLLMDRTADGFVSFTTDFGAAYTSICAGVVYTIAPGATVLVVSDEVPRYAVRNGAMLLAQALPYLPIGVHVGIVDPGVGTARQPVAISTGRGDVLIGPDNGLLPLAAERLGGMAAAYRLDSAEHRLSEVSATFHGRDVFAPAAGHLVAGVEVTDLGPSLPPESLTSPELPAPRPVGEELVLSVGYVDQFGSLILCGTPEDLGPLDPGAGLRLSWTGRAGSRHHARLTYQRTYGDVPPGDLLLFGDSSGWLGIAVNQGSAREQLGLGGGTEITLTRQ